MHCFLLLRQNSTICAGLTLPRTVNDWLSSSSSSPRCLFQSVHREPRLILMSGNQRLNLKFKYWPFFYQIAIRVTKWVHPLSDNPVWTGLSDNNIIMAVRLERNLCRSYLSWLSRVLVNVAFRKWGGLRGHIFRTTDSGIIIGRKIGLWKISRDAKLWTVILFNVQWEIYDCFYQENR